jgi:hypothetical protein
LLLVLAIARSIQVAGVAPNAFCPCGKCNNSSLAGSCKVVNCLL